MWFQLGFLEAPAWEMLPVLDMSEKEGQPVHLTSSPEWYYEHKKHQQSLKAKHMYVEDRRVASFYNAGT